MPAGFFVYGTLKRGQRNETVWPAKPIEVQIAWVHGRLFGRKEYPAMKPGDRLQRDHVLGEIWRFDETQVASVIESLDRLEGTNDNSPNDLYHRKVVEAFDLNHNSFGNVSTYFYVRAPIADGFELIEPDQDGYVSWLAPK